MYQFSVIRGVIPALWYTLLFAFYTQPLKNIYVYLTVLGLLAAAHGVFDLCCSRWDLVP